MVSVTVEVLSGVAEFVDVGVEERVLEKTIVTEAVAVFTEVASTGVTG
jgi:hypothetical protein